MGVLNQNHEAVKVNLGTCVEPVSFAVSPGDLHSHALVCGCDEASNVAICMRIAQMVKDCKRPVLIIEPDNEAYLAWAEKQNEGLAPEDKWQIYSADMDGGGEPSHKKLELSLFQAMAPLEGNPGSDWDEELLAFLLYDVVRADQSEELPDLFQKSCVVNLKGIRDASVKRFVMILLLLAARDYDKLVWMNGFSRTRGTESQGLARLVVVQGARRLFWKEGDDSVGAGSKPYDLSSALLDYLKDVRNYGQNVLLADPSPSLLGKDVVELAGLKMCGRLPCAGDQALMEEAMEVPSFRHLEDGEVFVRLGLDAPVRIDV